MAIRYALFPNHVTAVPNDYTTQIEITASADLDLITQRIIEQGSTVTKPDILAVLENMISACESFLAEGYRVNLGGLVDLYARIKGVFNRITEAFNHAGEAPSRAVDVVL